jgi:RHS repeat-associated protein
MTTARTDGGLLSRRAAAIAALTLAVALAAEAHADKSGVRPNVISVPGGPGTIGGLGEQFEPTLNTGSATYTVALDAPPGTAGVSPNLALRYDSGQGNGVCGMGWTLDVGSIQRQTAYGVPRYDARDRYVWDGQELVPVGGGVYRLAIEGAFLRFRQTGDHWEADAPDGTTYRFGVSPAARTGGTEGTFRWALEQIVDVSGNRIAFTYESDGGQLYLARVDYNQRPGAAANTIELGYETRPDAVTDLRGGFALTMARRLTSVRMLASGGQVRRYALGYEGGSPTSALSRLSTVTLYGTDDKTALPTLSFGYNGFDPSAQQVQTIANPPAFGLADPNVEIADFDGDGTADLVRTALGRHEFARNEGDSFARAVPIPSTPSVQLAATGTELADLNGDGIADLVSKLAPGTGDFVYFPNRGGGDWGAAVRFRNNPGFSFEDPGVRLIDFDGDGLVDVMQTTPTQFYYWRNNGDGSWSEPFGAAPPAGQQLLFSDPAVRLVDMNGDRLLDLVHVRAGAIVYWPNRGWGRWESPVSLAGAPDAGGDQPRLSLADLNGDGLTDAWVAAGSAVRIWLQRADGSFAVPVTLGRLPEAGAPGVVTRVADMNGNGTADVVWNDTRAGGGPAWQSLDLTGGVRPHLLTRIDNGMGRIVEIRYSSSGGMFRMAAAAATPWKTRLPIATQVVGTVTTSDGRGWSKQEAFVYADGYFDAATRQFRGFGLTRRIELGNDEEATSVQVHSFDVGATAEALKGVEVGREVQTAAGVVLRRETSRYDVSTYATGIDGRPVAGPQRRAHLVEHAEGTTTPVTTLEEWTYDDYGDVLLHADWGVVDGSNRETAHDERITTTTYAHDLERWLLGRPVEVVVADAAGTRLAASRTSYDGDPFVGLPLGTLGARGLPTRKEAWVEGDRFVATARVAYDDYGLTTATLDARGFRHEIDHDAKTHRFAVAERSLLAGGTVLTFTAGYDPVTGTLDWYSDPAGRRTTFAYTPLLQLRAVIEPGDSVSKPTATFAYTYGNPISEIVTRSRVESGGDAVLERHHHYDGLGRDLGLVEQAEGAKTVTTGVKVFGPGGRIVREIDPFFSTGFGLTQPPAGALFTAYRYDALGRRTRAVLPDGSATETRYGPLSVEHWDAEDLDPRSPHAGTPRVERSTGVGVVEVEERLGETTVTTSFERDGLGRVRRVVDGAGNVTTYDRDGAGRVRAVNHPDAGRSETEYDDAGNAIKRSDARDATVLATYDGVNRPLTETLVSAAGVVEQRIAYHYDSPSPRFPDDRFAAGALTWVEDGVGVEHYRHDDRDRLAEMIRVIDGKDYHLAEAHDDLDRLTRVTYPDGRTLDYRYNERGLLAQVPGIIDGVDYDERGFPTQRDYANGATSTAHYDALDRVDGLDTKVAGATVQSLTFGYDRVGNVRSIADVAHAAGSLSATRTLGYDDLYRLRTADGPTRRWSYDFDVVGNWRNKSDGGDDTYVAGRAHQPSRVTGTSGARDYAFDEAGQLTNRPGSTQTYDAKGRLASVTLTDGTAVAYRYDYAGAVAVKETTGPRGRHRTVYVDKLAEERDGDLVDYVFAGGLRVARLGGETPVPSATSAAFSRVPVGIAGAGILALALAALLAWAGPRPRRSPFGILPVRRGRRRCSPVTALGLACVVLGTSVASCGGHATTGGLAGAIYYHHDHLQGVALQTDERGTVITEAAYDPFGGDLAATTEPYAFTGKERDADTGLYHFGARAYDPALGLFLSPDPAVLEDPELAIDDPQLLNVYSYTRNNPTSHIDPDGRFPHILGGALVGALIGGAAYLVKGAITGSMSVRGATAAVVGGAVAGAVAAATAGASLLTQGALAGAYGGAAQRAMETGSYAKTFAPSAVAGDAILGAAGAGVAKAAVKVASKVAPKVVGAVKTVIARARGTSSRTDGPRLLNPPIRITPEGLRHVTERHTHNDVARFAGKSKFNPNEDVRALIDSASQQNMLKQTNGKFARIFDVGREIGLDRTTGRQTRVMTIITKPNGNLVTAFPGEP